MDLTAWMEQWNMFPPAGGVILCAVSGGRDSMCLLHYLHGLSRTRDFSVAAAHLHHGMRPTAERDEGLVREFCRQREIPFAVGYEKVYERAAEWGLGVEETGRRLRYAFLERTADDMGAQRIATAHHMGDQAETVLLNLLRGTGPEGLGGIPPVRGRLIRPLLDTTREEIEAYLTQWHIPYAEDETNGELSYARNRLRLTVWPTLERINGAARENIARAARIQRRENMFLDELALSWLPERGREISCERLLAAPEALRPRILRLMIDRLSCGKKDFSHLHLAALERLAATGGVLDLPAGARAVCRGGVLRLEMAGAIEPEEVSLMPEVPQRWGDYTLCLRQTDEAAAPDAIRLRRGGTVTVRRWRSGDRLTLPDSRGPRTLKRLFADKGVEPPARDRAPVVCVDGVPAAAYGIGTDVTYMPEIGGPTAVIIIQKNGQEEKENGA